MIFVITFAIIAAIIAFISENDSYYGEPLAGAFFAFFGGALAGTILALLIGLFSTMPVEKEYQLANLQDGQSITGTFFLGTGSVDGEMRFSYYKEEAPNTFTLNTVDADYAKVIQDQDNGTAFMKVTRHTSKLKTNLWGFRVEFNGVDTEFHVPAKSIKQNFTLDAQ